MSQEENKQHSFLKTKLYLAVVGLLLLVAGWVSSKINASTFNADAEIIKVVPSSDESKPIPPFHPIEQRCIDDLQNRISSWKKKTAGFDVISTVFDLADEAQLDSITDKNRASLKKLIASDYKIFRTEDKLAIRFGSDLVVSADIPSCKVDGVYMPENEELVQKDMKPMTVARQDITVAKAQCITQNAECNTATNEAFSLSGFLLGFCCPTTPCRLNGCKYLQNGQWIPFNCCTKPGQCLNSPTDCNPSTQQAFSNSGYPVGFCCPMTPCRKNGCKVLINGKWVPGNCCRKPKNCVTQNAECTPSTQEAFSLSGGALGFCCPTTPCRKNGCKYLKNGQWIPFSCCKKP